MLPLLGAVAVDGWISHQNASATATVVQDRMLLGSARIVAEQLHFEDGAFQDNVPPAALELFESGEIDQVYYRVTTGSGQIVTGYAELALPGAELQPETPHFFDSVVRGAPVRAVAFLQPVLASPGVRPVLVEIAQTMNGHAALTRSLWLHTIGQQLLLLALVAMLVLFGLRRGLLPLLHLRDTVAAREPGSLQPLAFDAMPAELSPLVVAINEYARRLDQYAGAQRVFIQNAAHQLRTPLTLLTTQVSYALRAADSVGREESLAAIRNTVQQSARLVNQLLTLSAVEAQDHAEPAEAPVALDALIRKVLEDLAGQAQAKKIDLGFEQAGSGPTVLAAQRLALREIAMNLVDNAIRYTQPGGRVTTRIEASPDAVTLVVEDNGPGIAPSERERVFERFYRIHDGDSAGSGLGLPIVREFASRMGASVELRTSTSGQGLTVAVRFKHGCRAADA
jgi:two-component system sensor histidine kinase TctE